MPWRIQLLSPDRESRGPASPRRPAPKRTVSGVNGHTGTDRTQVSHHLSNAPGNLPNLHPRDVLRDGRDVEGAKHVQVCANHPGEPGGRFRPTSAPAVRRVARVVALVDDSKPKMDVGGHRKVLGSHATSVVP